MLIAVDKNWLWNHVEKGPCYTQGLWNEKTPMNKGIGKGYPHIHRLYYYY